jgi:hypothetical protein
VHRGYRSGYHQPDAIELIHHLEGFDLVGSSGGLAIARNLIIHNRNGLSITQLFLIQLLMLGFGTFYLRFEV